MKTYKTFLLSLLMLFGFVGSAMGQTVIAVEDFDGSTPSWTNDISSQTFVDPTDADQGLFIEPASANNLNFSGDYLLGRDVEGEGGEPGYSTYIFTFDEVDISSFSNVELTFDYSAVGNADDGSYELIIDGVSQGAVEYFNDPDSRVAGTITEFIGSANTVSLIISGSNNGASDEIELDNFKLAESSIKGEPSSHAASFAASSTSIERINLSWTDAHTGTLPDTYLILANDDNSFTTPSDATAQTDDSDLSDGTGVLNISQGTQSASFSGLDPNTQYYFEIYPYTNTGSNIDYKTDGTIPTATATTLEAPDLVLNEILADPANDITGDANGDGTRSSSEDEFLEFINTGNSDLTISNWTIEVGGSTEHTFSDPTVLKPMQAIVIFGGGNPIGEFGNSLVQTTSNFGLTNSGTTISVKDGGGNTLIYHSYDGATDQSETRNPDLTGAFTDHTTANPDTIYSPGLRSDGSTFQPSVTITGSEGWRMLSAPTLGNSYADLLDPLWTQGITTGADVTNGSANVHSFNGTSFSAVNDLTATMTAGQGFIVYVYSDDDYDGTPEGFPKRLDLFGTENTGSVSPALTSGADEWTLVGNPYNSTIDWDDLTTTDLTGVVYVYDHSYGTPGVHDTEASGSAGSYRTWNGSLGSLSDGLIKPFQGFWVQNLSSGTPSLTIDEADKTTGGTFYKESKNESVSIKLRAEMDDRYNEAFLSFTEHGEIDKDNFDALKLSPLDFRNYLSLATVTGQTKLDINNLPDEFGEIEVPVSIQAFNADMETGFWIEQGGEVELSWSEMENVPESWSVTLHDYKTGESSDMKAIGSYSFTLEGTMQKAKTAPRPTILNPQPVQAEKAKTSDVEGSRFVIVISGGTSVTNEQTDQPQKMALKQNYPNPFNPTTSIYYSIPEAGEVNLTIYNVMGQRVHTLVDGQKSAGEYRVTWNATNMASGIYYYRFNYAGQVITRQMTLIK